LVERRPRRPEREHHGDAADRLRLDDPGTGRFTGGGDTVTAAGIKLTRGFTIHCDLILSNNLEINWSGTGRQNQFHMLEHTSAICTDDPAIGLRVFNTTTRPALDYARPSAPEIRTSVRPVVGRVV